MLNPLLELEMENLERDILDALDEYWAEEYEQDYVKPSSDSDKFNIIDAFDKAKIIATILIALIASNLLPVGISRANTGTLNNTTDKPETTTDISSSAASDYLTSNTINESNVTSVKAANEPPQIKGSLNAGGFVNEPFTWNYSFYVSDPDGDEITATSDDPEHISWDGLVATFNYSKVGNYSVNLTFTDSHGANVSGTAIIKIVERKEKEFIRAAHGGELRDSDGHIDVDKTIEALKNVYANAIVLEPAYDKQWEDILNFLPAANENNIKVFLILPDARTGVGPCGFCEHWRCNLPKPYCKDYVKWMEVLANLSLQYPVLEGVFIDDFECGIFSNPQGNYTHPGFTVEYIEEVMQAKNRINPNFKFFPGIYLPRGYSDFKIGQKCEAPHNSYVSLSTTVNYTNPVGNATLEFITHNYPTSCYKEQILVNGEVIFEQSVDEEPMKWKKFDLTDYDLTNLTITYKIIKLGYVCYLSNLVQISLYINGEEIPLNWSIEGDACYDVLEYYKLLRNYYNLTDGVIFWSNAFDLVEPENEFIEELLNMAREKIGEDKVIFGHFYGAEPWKEPVFPSDYYFDTFAKINIQKTDGVKPWYAFLLPYYLNYSSGIYSQPENDNPSYDFRFYYPGYTTYELGFYQGIETEITLPKDISDINITFKIRDSYTGDSYYRRWVKEFVIKNSGFTQNFSCRSGKNCLWFKDNGTLWWDFIAGDEGDQEIFIPYEKISAFISPCERITLVLRMRADEFRGAGSAPPTVNVYVTKPRIIINGEEIKANWKFVSGNALENLWLKSSEHIKTLYSSNWTSS